jgi:hypothetical protein
VGSTLQAEHRAANWTPSSDADRSAVHAQLDKLLATPLFNSSKRYPSFLKFVVSHALAGQTDQLKERILGVEIFGRPADYDTNTDPIVRVTAAEIRKRIELYYHDPAHSQDLRVILPSGSYVPLFSWPARSNGHAGGAMEAPVPVGADSILAQPKVDETAPGATEPRQEAASWKGLIFGAGFLLAGIIAASIWYGTRPSLTKQFWEPFIKSPEPVVFCIADQSQFSSIRLRDASDPQKEQTLTDSMVTIIIDDVSPLVNVAGLLRTYGKTYRVSAESTTSLTDLRRGPSVFIGAFDNSWTLRLTGPLRYHFANDPGMTRFWIEDHENPGQQHWEVNRTQQQQTGTYKDYALVTRFVDPNTDQYAVVAAGLARGGTVAAGEFLVDSKRMEEMLGQVPADWKHKNLEIVLETQVIENRSGSPHIVAVHVW